MRNAWLMCCAVGCAPAVWADPITYSNALARADESAPAILAARSAVDAAQLAIGPAGQLPDPKLALSLDNYPVSGPAPFQFGREEMTMLSAGVMQDVPSQAARRARTRIASAEAGQAQAELEIARLEARLAAGRAWIELFALQERIEVLQQIASDVAELERAANARLASATGTADAALAAKMDAVLISNQLAEAEAAASGARAELERWIGPLTGDELGPDMPVFSVDALTLRGQVVQHAVLASSRAVVEQARAELEASRATRRSDWSWSLMYGRRDDDFGDMVSAGVTFSLPLFQSSRQGPAIASKTAELARASAASDAARREQQARLEGLLARHGALGARLNRATTTLAPLAQQREDLAAAAHAAGTAPVADLIAARRAKHDVQLDVIDLERELALVGAQLALEFGGGQP